MRPRGVAAALVALVTLASSCGVLSDEQDPLISVGPDSPADPTDTDPEVEPEPQPGDLLAEEAATSEVADDLGDHDLVVDLTGDGAPFDRRLLGTNLPAWLGPDHDRQDFFAAAFELAGVELLRFPGGSWSNHYAWLDCLEETDGCFWPWAMTVEDFARVITTLDDDTEFMWTVHYNGTPEEAAALVAFFNGSVDDDTPIGVDVDGFDWGTEADWARRRAELGFAEPLPIRYWEIGNEIYGAVQSAGPECASFGWEEIATCDGTEYMLGVDDQAGFGAYADAMRAVDPTIELGAVGVPVVESWGNFGNEVLAEAEGLADFYIVHWYGFDGSPDPDWIPGTAEEFWSPAMADLREAMAGWGVDDLEIAVTEYNLISFRNGDGDAVMRTAANAFFQAEMLGELAKSGVALANQWNIFDADDQLGTSYGMVDANSGAALPALFGFRAWALMGDTLRPVLGDGIAAYATTSADGSVQLLLLNPTGAPRSLSIGIEGGVGAWTATADTMRADALTDRVVTYNGSLAESVTDLHLEATPIGTVDDALAHTIEPYSITVLQLTPS
ncbi:MAG: alpha-L-arabinofuranosidase [Actinomycetota bacterium]